MLYYEDEKITIYCGDCREVLRGLKGITSIITDPPYGINLTYNGCNSIHKERIIVGDKEEFDPQHLLNYKNVILWGANNYCWKLKKGGWILWDKRCSEKADKMIGSPFELAWVNNENIYKMIRVQHGGLLIVMGMKGFM